MDIKKSEFKDFVLPIVLALIAGYFAVRSATEPIRLQAELTQTAAAQQTDAANLITGTIESTETILTEALSSPTLFPTDAPIQTPPLPSETGVAVLRILDENCISRAWIPYEKDSSIVKNGDCWDLSNWGFYSTTNGFLLTPTSSLSDGIFHGVYLPISGNVEVRFTIDISKFIVDNNYSANIGVGIINTNPPGPATAGILYYHYIPANSLRILPMKYGQNGEYNLILPFTLEIGSEQQEVILKIEGPLLYITIDGVSYEPQILQFQDRAFWVSYSIPRGNSQLIANIRNLVIEQK